MIRQVIKLAREAWTLEVWYDARSADSTAVGRRLKRMGCDDWTRSDALTLVGEDGSGFTYSDSQRRVTLSVLSATSAPARFLNLLAHEMVHAAAHISSDAGSVRTSENYAYLCGDLMEGAYAVARQFL